MKTDVLSLREAIPSEEFDYLTLMHALSAYKAPRQKVNELLKAGTIVRVKKGIYVFSRRLNRVPVCLEVLANQIYGPSCLSLEYALSFHGLIPERVVELTSVTPKRNKVFSTPVGRFSYRYLSRSRFPHGVDRVVLDERHPILIATPEKALCDYIVLSSSIRLFDRESVREFLEKDLRCDPELWGSLSKTTLESLSLAYKDPRLEVLWRSL